VKLNQTLNANALPSTVSRHHKDYFDTLKIHDNKTCKNIKKLSNTDYIVINHVLLFTHYFYSIYFYSRYDQLFSHY